MDRRSSANSDLVILDMYLIKTSPVYWEVYDFCSICCQTVLSTLRYTFIRTALRWVSVISFATSQIFVFRNPYFLSIHILYTFFYFHILPANMSFSAFPSTTGQALDFSRKMRSLLQEVLSSVFHQGNTLLFIEFFHLVRGQRFASDTWLSKLAVVKVGRAWKRPMSSSHFGAVVEKGALGAESRAHLSICLDCQIDIASRDHWLPRFRNVSRSFRWTWNTFSYVLACAYLSLIVRFGGRMKKRDQSLELWKRHFQTECCSFLHNAFFNQLWNKKKLIAFVHHNKKNSIAFLFSMLWTQVDGNRTGRYVVEGNSIIDVSLLRL